MFKRDLSRVTLAVALAAVGPVGARSAFAARHVYVGAQQQGVGGIVDLFNNEGLAVSPDGSHVYAATAVGDAVVIFARDAVSGALAYVGAASDPSFDDPTQLVITADGNYVYAAGNSSGGVFSRNTGTGQLTFVEKQDTGDVAGLLGATGIAMSPDDLHVYVVAVSGDTLVVFSRNTTTGVLTHVETQTNGLGGVGGMDEPRGVTVSPDGSHVYVAGATSDAIAIYSRNSLTGALTFVGFVQDGVGGVDGLNGVHVVAVSADGDHLYAAAENGVTAFSRDSGTGALTFVEHQATGGGDNLALSADGVHVYVANGIVSDSVVVFERDASTGELTQEEEFIDDVNAVNLLGGVRDLAVSPDGANFYTGAENAVSTFRQVTVACAPSAMGGCFQPALPGKAKLVLSDNPTDSRDKLVWKWLKGAALTIGDFGDPATTTNDYALCLYSSAGGAVLEAELLAPAAGGCGAAAGGGATPCWTANAVGFKYRRGDRHPDGMVSAKLIEGAAEMSKVLAKAKGEAVPLPALPLALPITVQMQNADGTCWEAVYSSALVNDGVLFRATAD